MFIYLARFSPRFRSLSSLPHLSFSLKNLTSPHSTSTHPHHPPPTSLPPYYLTSLPNGDVCFPPIHCVAVSAFSHDRDITNDNPDITKATSTSASKTRQHHPAHPRPPQTGVV